MTPQELKNSILQLAIQGKLVEQRPEEGTAQELYAQIQAEKQRLIQSGKLKKEKPLPKITEDEKPFEIPDGWMWVRLGSIIRLVSGTDFKPNEYNDQGKGTVYITGASSLSNTGVIVSRWTEEPKNFAYKGDILLVCKGSGYGKAVFCDVEKAHIARQIMAIRLMDKMDMKYIRFFLQASITYVKAKGQGVIPGIDRGSILNMCFSLPPFAEQKRIVAKIEELLPLVDRYDHAWTKLEDFNRRFPEDMKKSILQQAIQGKLVEQRPEEGTAQELYAQIQAEKQRLIKEGKIKKEKPLPEITEDEKPFEIPDGWMWVRLSEICKSISDGDHQPPPQVSKGIPFLVISNVSSGVIDFSNIRYVPQSYYSKLTGDRIARIGDILFTVTGSYGIPIKVETSERFCFQRHIALLKLMIDWNYIYYALKSPFVKSQCDSMATGTAQKTVGLKALRNLVIPFPPLAEQKRIVARLEELLPLCERLK